MQQISMGRQAFVTLITRDRDIYLLGALVLARSIQLVDGLRDRVLLALVSCELEARSLDLLQAMGYRLVKVERVAELFLHRCTDERIHREDRIERWSGMFSKLRLWELTGFEQVLYLDLDTILLNKRAVDAIFALETDLAAERGRLGRHSGWNAGVILLRPSNLTATYLWEQYHNLRLSPSNAISVFGSFLDCTEQAFLNKFLPNVSDIQIGRSDSRNGFRYHRDQDLPGIVHWIGAVCPKPWTLTSYNCTIFSRRKCVPEPYIHWWKMFQSTEEFFLQTEPR
jgi:hypothetical protein